MKILLKIITVAIAGVIALIGILYVVDDTRTWMCLTVSLILLIAVFAPSVFRRLANKFVDKVCGLKKGG